MIIGFIISVIAVVTLLALGIFNENTGAFLIGIISGLAVEVALFCGIALFADVKERPVAIDVYRGKTTLEITYRDSVAVDSVVVWKEE